MSTNKSKPLIGSSTNLESPKCLKNFEFGVGLAIVAALEDTVPASANKALFTRNLSRSKPAPISIESNELTAVKKTKSVINNKSVFHISADRFGEIGEILKFPPPDFLSSCNLCMKKLKDKDIYMYRGEKAFCSTECRYNQIVMDERKEKCSSEAATAVASAVRAVDVVSSSPYDNGRMFTNEILAI